MDKEKVVVIVSGGMDSTTLLYDVISQGKEPYVLSFDYGQRHKKELQCAKKTCKALNITHKIVRLDALNQLAKSSLTRSDINVPHGRYDDENMKITVVPNRNMVMLSLAVSYAITIDASKVYYAPHSGDHRIYADCRPEFVSAMNNAVGLCDFKHVEIVAPYLNMDKGDIVIRGKQLNVDYSKTWTCYEGEKLACGLCGSCTERLEAFEKAGIVDPVKYNI